MTVSAEALAYMNRDPDFNDELAKSQPGVGDVHVASTGSKKKKPPAISIEDDFASTLVKLTAVDGLPDIRADRVEHWLSQLSDRSPVEKATVPALKPHPDGGAYAPFPHDPDALGKIDPKHTRMFLSALTNPDALETRRLPIKSLVALQPRVSPEKVNDMRQNGYSKLPTVVRNDGKNLIADGNHRAAASFLDGESSIECKYCRLSGDDETLAKSEDVEFTFAIKKADPDKQLIFGWASVVQKGDYLIIDKQGDMILPEDLETGAYDFVLDARHHGTMHTDLTGRMVESMVFTKEKQTALGIIVKDAASGEQIVGWWVGFKVDSPEVWKAHKEGKLPEFSIGGASLATEMQV